MRKQVLTGLLCISAVMAFNSKSSAQTTDIYYWDFNGTATDSAGGTPTFRATGAGNASYLAWDAYTDFTTGSSVNLQAGDYAGSCIRFRNPSDSVTFRMPTTGFKNVVFSYAEQRTNSGALQNTVMYTTDGVHFVTTSAIDLVDSSTYTIDSTDYVTDSSAAGLGWELRTFSFSADTATNNNPHFAVTIVFDNGADSASGNNRFDNVVLKGTVVATTPPSYVPTIAANTGNYTLYPNPATNTITVSATNDDQTSFTIYNVMGQKVIDGVNKGKSFSVNTADFATGMYYINISDNTTGNVTALKFVK